MAKKKKTSQKWKLYEVKGGKVVRKNKFCPRCGPGVFWPTTRIAGPAVGVATPSGRSDSSLLFFRR